MTISSTATNEESLQSESGEHQSGVSQIKDPSVTMEEDTLRSKLDEGQPSMQSIENPLSNKCDNTQPSVQLCQENESTMEIESNETSPNITHQDNPAVPIQDPESVPTIQLLQDKLKKSDKKIEMLKKKLKLSQPRSRRLKKKVFSLKDVVNELRNKNLISQNCEDMLNQTFEGVPLQLMKRVRSSKKSGKGRVYTPELKSFALTLQFYSSKAYSFLRKTFNLALPSQSQIRRWYSKIPADPGFTEPAFNALKLKAEEAKENGKEVLCSLMLDEMSIKKHVSWDGHKYQGYVDLGNGADDDSLPLANDALVFMVVSLNSSWKVPCGYFFIDGLSGKERANLVKVCIQLLYDIGVSVTSLTCDGPSCHISMLTELGLSVDLSNMVTYFLHPQDPKRRMYVFLDICHMLKLVRNTFGEWGTLVNRGGEKISWQYLVELHNLQDAEGLRLANKLKKIHINWKQQKMKVNLAAQALSSSVANALEYCGKELKLPKFQGCEATVEFIRMFDHLFDILNSRNPLAKGYKAPLRPTNKFTWDAFLTDVYDYIIKLENSTGVKMCKTKRKTGFIGFLIGINSIRQMFHDLVESKSPPLQYVLTYKMSQDHLELFFCAIHACGGFNNNPTTKQFTAAYKRLVLRSHIEGEGGNCEKRDPISILTVLEDSGTVNGHEISISNVAMIRRYDLDGENSENNIDDYSDSPSISTLSQYKQAAISYIAGYVGKKVQKSTNCRECSMALGSVSGEASSSFLVLKDHGNLFKPTSSVIKVCEETERCLQRMLAVTEGHFPNGCGVSDAIVPAVLGSLPVSSLFQELDNHLFHSPVGDNHVIQLIKNVIKCYSKVKFYHLGKKANDDGSGEKIRKKLSKLILFKHQ